jgi:hypothetical protein
MQNPPQDPDDDYEPAELGDTADLDEDARLKIAEDVERRETRREILLGQIAVARSDLYDAQAAGDAAKVAALEQKLAKLTAERDGL